MEHDEKCERFGVAKTIASVLALGPGEYQFLYQGKVPLGVACDCDRRAESKFYTGRPKRFLRDAAILFIENCREEGVQLEGYSGVEALMLVAREDSRVGSNVIPVDFKLGRRID